MKKKLNYKKAVLLKKRSGKFCQKVHKIITNLHENKEIGAQEEKMFAQ